jgi:hypothetical protein
VLSRRLANANPLTKTTFKYTAHTAWYNTDKELSARSVRNRVSKNCIYLTVNLKWLRVFKPSKQAKTPLPSDSFGNNAWFAERVSEYGEETEDIQE